MPVYLVGDAKRMDGLRGESHINFRARSVIMTLGGGGGGGGYTLMNCVLLY